jgi:hypothetical protein
MTEFRETQGHCQIIFSVIIVAIGYPPITETPKLNVDRWTYWNSRFDRFIVRFENDRVARIQD